jgi:hypothetical protein
MGFTVARLTIDRQVCIYPTTALLRPATRRVCRRQAHKETPFQSLPPCPVARQPGRLVSPKTTNPVGLVMDGGAPRRHGRACFGRIPCVTGRPDELSRGSRGCRDGGRARSTPSRVGAVARGECPPVASAGSAWSGHRTGAPSPGHQTAAGRVGAARDASTSSAAARRARAC